MASDQSLNLPMLKAYWLSPLEIEELRQNKKELGEYARNAFAKLQGAATTSESSLAALPNSEPGCS